MPKDTLYILGEVSRNPGHDTAKFLIKKSKGVFFISGSEETKILSSLNLRMIANTVGGIFFLILGILSLFFFLRS